MTQVINLDQIIAQKVKTLAIDQQQQVLDFVDFLHSRISKTEISDQKKNKLSFLEATKEFAGCLEGEPSDLSTNKIYLEDLGKA
jgi:uncharacterized UBP type Zn finger protein